VQRLLVELMFGSRPMLERNGRSFMVIAIAVVMQD
jgi:hypothetical protein